LISAKLCAISGDTGWKLLGVVNVEVEQF